MKNNPHYAPENLLNMLQQLLGLRNDAHLADRLGVEPSQICKIRHRKGVVSGAFLINAHEETGLSIGVLRGLMGDYRESTAASAKHPEEPPLHCLHQLNHPSMLPAFARASTTARAPQQQHHA
ncbi:hypothetical protein ACFPOU_07865 [Massilia jejuensis]|uniref:Helix-turn-helix protein n=1 Tax=Massilia jejuensis TaxID=648894 RepID=A0ABW0PEE8_9BURK